MKQLWGYVSAFLAGVVLMAIIALKWFNGDDYTTEIKKLKNKNSSDDISVPINVESAQKEPKLTWKQRRAKKKLDRLNKKD